MPSQQYQLDMVLVFFVYGLAFFSMGLALILEMARSPLLAERRVIRPLAVFGLLHGGHEWLEIVILQGVWLNLPFPQELSWFRVALLAASFFPLIIFGAMVLLSGSENPRLYLYLATGLLIFYASMVFLNTNVANTSIINRSDALARYILAVPGGILAGMAMLRRARDVQREQRTELAHYFRWAALGFGLYGITQIFVSPVDMFPARYLNTDTFISVAGFPVQVIRASMAMLVTVNLIKAIQWVERERQEQLILAQKARVEALEQVQHELVERETLRRDLLRHTVIAQEAERARIARELHDETSQVLTAFTLSLATLGNYVDDRPEITPILHRLQELSRHMSQGIYRLVHDLRPAQLDDLGLVPALQYLIDEGKQRLGVEVTLCTKGQRRRVDPLVETVVFRVAQEAITNVSRHAQTALANMELRYNTASISLLVSDQGVGFDVNQNLSPPRGWGLAGMRERAESIGGQFVIESSPGHGTVVEVVIPLACRENQATGDAHQEIRNEKHSADVS